MKNSFENFGSWAIITGASSGIGLAFAEGLAKKGMNLVLIARRGILLAEIAKSLQSKNSIEVKTIEADLSDSSSIKLIESETKSLDIGLLVNNAGTGRVMRFLDLDVEEILKHNQLNALSPLALSHIFAKKMKEKGRGGIIFSGAMGALDGLPFMASMAASKAFNHSLALGLREEFKEHNIRVMSVSITPTETPILDTLGFRNSKMPMKPLETSQVVAESLKAFMSNKSHLIPGFKFRLMNGLMPPSLKRAFMAKTFRKNNNL